MVSELMKELEKLKGIVKQKEAAAQKWQKEAEAAGEIASKAAQVRGAQARDTPTLPPLAMLMMTRTSDGM